MVSILILCFIVWLSCILDSSLLYQFYDLLNFWYAKKWSPEKCPSKIVLRENNARKLKRLLHFYQLIPLHTQKDVWRLHHDPTYAPNRRTLKESRKICCRVLGFHRLITSEHSTHTPRCSTLTPRFFVSVFWVCFRVLDLLSSFEFS